MKKLNIVLAGPRGKMGSEAIKMIEQESSFQLVAYIDRIPNYASSFPTYTSINECFENEKIDIFLDLTNPETAKKHVQIALEYAVPSVIGTTGFSHEELRDLTSLSKKKQVGIIIAPNFSIGAILMMKFSEMASTYFDDAEIVELHHPNKLDSPSGTSLKTAQMMKKNMNKKQEEPHQARGLVVDGVPIHSVRLPGLLAHQEVLFGKEGEGLSIRHDTFDRKSFMPGIKLALKQVIHLHELIYGLEHFIN